MERIIAADEQEISDQTADQLTEDSAPRATVEELKINAAYQEIQVNLALMAQHHCVPYDHPIGASYLADAIRRKTDRMKGVLSGNVAIPDSCDRTKWTRMN